MAYRLLYLAVLISSASLAAPAKDRIIFWHQEIGDRVLVDEMLKDFEHETGVTIESTALSSDHFKVSLLKLAKRGQMPDIALCPGDYASIYQELELSPLNREAKDKAFGGIPSELWASTTAGGAPRGIPMILGNHLLLFYNKRHVAQPPTSWFDLAVLSRKSGHPMVGINYSEMYWFVPFVLMQGDNLVVGNRTTLNTPAMIKGLIHYKDLADQGIVDAKCSYDCSSRDFYAGKYNYAINGDWALTEARRQLGTDLGIAPLPKLDGKPLPSYYSTMALMFPGQSLSGPKAEKLRQLAKFLLGPKAQDRLWRESRRIPADREAYKRYRADAKSDDQAMLDALAGDILMPAEPAMAYAWEAIRRGFLQFIRGEKSPEAAAAAMQQDVEKGMAKNGVGGIK